MKVIRRRSVLRGGALLALSGAGLQSRAEGPSAKAGSPRVRIGQIGVGHGHAAKLGVYRASPDYEVVGIVEPDEALRARAQGQPAFLGLPWMTTEQLLNVAGLEAVLVETRVADSLAAAEACIAAGKHVHLDKPAGASLPRFRRLLESAQANKLIVQMGYMYRYNPGIVLLRELLAKGWLGEIFEVHAVMSKVVAPAERRQVAEFSGGMMFELGCHLIDLIIGLLGKPEQVTAFGQHAAKLDDSLKDNALAVLSYPRAIASVKSSAMEVDGFERRHLVACGSEGTFQIQPLDRPRARVVFSKPREGHRSGVQEIELPRYDRYIADAADMAKIIRGEKASDFSYMHDLDVQETILRASGMTLDV